MNVALIPARGGSKRINKKNIKNFCGKPIIKYSIETAFASACFDRIIVSTDCPEIASIAIESGAEVPFYRPTELSNDYASTLDVIKHAITELDLRPQDHICCIYPTAPFLTPEDLKGSLKLFASSKFDYVFSATHFHYPIQRALRSSDSGLVEMYFPKYGETRSQDLEPTYHDAGQFYWCDTNAVMNDKSFFVGARAKMYLLPLERVHDIDTVDDWRKAQLLYRILNSD